MRAAVGGAKKSTPGRHRICYKTFCSSCASNIFSKMAVESSLHIKCRRQGGIFRALNAEEPQVFAPVATKKGVPLVVVRTPHRDLDCWSAGELPVRAYGRAARPARGPSVATRSRYCSDYFSNY